MSEARISKIQIEEASGTFAQTVQAESGIENFTIKEDSVPAPSFNEAALFFGAEQQAPSFDVSPTDERLINLGGLRVKVGVLTKDGKPVELPGIVLPDFSGRIGCLSGPDIIRDSPLNPLSDLQQTMLEQIAAMHMPNVGEHPAGAVNAGDTGHAALIAITGPGKKQSIHGRTHEYVGTGLAQEVSNTGALNIASGHDSRVVKEVILSSASAASITVPENYQLPSSLKLKATDMAVGVTLAAVRSQGDGYPQPDLAGNTAAILGQKA